MLFYTLYIFIFASLIKLLNINIIIEIINIIFYYSSNSVYFIGIILGIILKILKTNKLKNINKYLFLIFIDITKIILIKYNLLFILISLIITIFIISIKNINKVILYILYLIFPISSYIFIYKLKNIKNYYLIIFPCLVYVIFKYYKIIINCSYKNIIGFIILFMLSYFLFNNNTKKRNIIIIFLLFIYLLYFFILV